MGKERIAGFRQLLSAGAVVASLVFVGVEIQRNTLAQRSATRQALADASRDLILAVTEDPLLEAWIGRWGRPPHFDEGFQITPLDSARADVAMRALLRNAENVFFQYREGVIDESVLATYGFAGGSFASPAFPEYWRSQRDQWDPDFVAAFEDANGLR